PGHDASAVPAARVQGLPRPLSQRPARRRAGAARRSLCRAVPHLPRATRQAASRGGLGRGGWHVVEERLPDPGPHQLHPAVRSPGPAQAGARRGAGGAGRALTAGLHGYPRRRAMARIRNPVLQGFHPDPSILRVGDDYYIATSTFEWYPGVAVSHSRDLAHWRSLAPPLSRPSQLDLRGRPNSGGVWAPALSHADGLFHLIYTDVRGWAGDFKDVRNFLVTAPAIEGPWSDPVHLNNSGFDPSLFHDIDGRKWLVNMVWDHRPGH